MRKRSRWLFLVAALVAAGIGFVVVARPWSRPEVPRPPSLTFTQDDERIRVVIHNVNREWGLRDQPVRMWLRGPGRVPIVVLGPTGEHEIIGAPDRKFECCVVETLPPDGEFVFELPPVDLTVAEIELTLPTGDVRWSRTDW